MAFGGKIRNIFVFNATHIKEIYSSHRPKRWFHLNVRNTGPNIPGMPTLISRLSPNEVTAVLRANEYSHEFNSGPVKSYDSNQLASNNPMEDTRAEAKILLTNGILMGVFDGHGGAACAQVLAKRLLSYTAASLLSQDDLKDLTKSVEKFEDVNIIENYNDRNEFVSELKDRYINSFKAFVHDLCLEKRNNDYGAKEALEKSFVQLDNDISKEAKEDSDSKFLSVSMSGAVACVSHIQDSHLHVANVGDCQAVLGVLNENKVWTAKKMSVEHNSENQSEVQRLLSAHLPEESEMIIEKDRLLGQLIPLRAFGDFRYKWSRELLEEKAVPFYGPNVIPPRYLSPPYLSANPEILYHRLTPKDKFLVIASDGLWDMLSPLQVDRAVGCYDCNLVAFRYRKVGGVGEEPCVERFSRFLIQRPLANPPQPLLQHPLKQ